MLYFKINKFNHSVKYIDISLSKKYSIHGLEKRNDMNLYDEMQVHDQFQITKHIPRNEAFYERLVSHCLKITHQNGSFLAGEE